MAPSAPTAPELGPAKELFEVASAGFDLNGGRPMRGGHFAHRYSGRRKTRQGAALP